MNRLWVRFSLAFIGVILLMVLAGIASSIVIGYFELDPVQQQITVEVSEETIARIDGVAQRAFPRTLIRFLLISTVVGILMGVLLSRSLTAPLSKLAEGAKAIGEQDLSRRVEVEGSDEIQEVAQAFNEMADKLAEAETLRQNLLADVAHELRTPMTVLQGNLRAILDGVYALEEAEIVRLYDQTRHLTRLVNDLHELALAEAHELPLTMAAVDLAGLVKETQAVFEPLADEAGVGLRVELLGRLPMVQGDGARLRQALYNLLSNALKYSPAGSSITIQLEQTNAEVQLRVCDTGQGLAPEHVAHVFDRFYRADKARSRDTGGTGLGLAIVRAIVEGHSGRVTVESAGVGQGSTFTIHLPTVV